MKSCIIYYSHSGHTRRLAEQIAKRPTETCWNLSQKFPIRRIIAPWLPRPRRNCNKRCGQN